jgi:hypothetical protein
LSQEFRDALGKVQGLIGQNLSIPKTLMDGGVTGRCTPKPDGRVPWASSDAVDRHANQLEAITDRLPTSLRCLWNDFYLHDAEVLAMGRQGETFVIVLRLDVPPRELLILNYQLVEEPIINPEALPRVSQIIDYAS